MFFVLIALVIEAFTFFFAKFWQWFFKTRKGSALHASIMVGAFVFSNGVLVLTVSRYWRFMFRVTAGWMILLLFTLFASFAVMTLWLLLKNRVAKPKLDIGLRTFGALFFFGLTAYSVYSAYMPTVKHISLTIDKPLDKPVRIGVASDLHLGFLFRGKQIDDLARIMNQEKVDAIFLPGDIMDDSTEFYLNLNMKQNLQKLKAPLGVYATMGNHDLFGHEHEIHQALTEAGIKVLNDEAVFVDNRFWVVGRPDDTARGRTPSQELILKTDTAQPVFLLDHRPTSIHIHEKLPIDLQVSGHVHNGQVFPANIIVKFLNRLAYGHEKIGLGHYIVTSGYGFWGVPFRLGSQSEVWIVDISSNQNKQP